MANAEKDVLDEIEEPKKKGMKLPVLIGVILGIIIVQVGIVFAAIKFMAPADAHNEKDKHKTEQEAEEKDGEKAHEAKDGEEEENDGKAELVQKVEAIVTTKNDLYINPRGTSSHIVVLSLGIEVSPAEKAKEVEEKLMVPIQDKVIGRISGYTTEELQRSDIRDSLRTIIKKDIKPFFLGMEEVKLRNVYFPKFVIQ
ncbi:MAG: flagellar basal body-associated FliL family protein [Candidatus Kapaibacterium sp.]